MKAFYKNRQASDYNKAEALQQAQLDFLHGRNLDAQYTTSVVPTKRGSVAIDKEIVIEPEYRIPFKAEIIKPFAHPYYWSPFVLYGNWK